MITRYWFLRVLLFLRTFPGLLIFSTRWWGMQLEISLHAFASLELNLGACPSDICSSVCLQKRLAKSGFLWNFFSRDWYRFRASIHYKVKLVHPFAIVTRFQYDYLWWLLFFEEFLMSFFLKVVANLVAFWVVPHSSLFSRNLGPFVIVGQAIRYEITWTLLSFALATSHENPT